MNRFKIFILVLFIPVLSVSLYFTAISKYNENNRNVFDSSHIIKVGIAQGSVRKLLGQPDVTGSGVNGDYDGWFINDLGNDDEFNISLNLVDENKVLFKVYYSKAMSVSSYRYCR